LATTKAIHIGPDMPPIAGSDAVQVTMIDTTAATFRTIRGLTLAVGRRADHAIGAPKHTAATTAPTTNQMTYSGSCDVDADIGAASEPTVSCAAASAGPPRRAAQANGRMSASTHGAKG